MPPPPFEGAQRNTSAGSGGQPGAWLCGVWAPEEGQKGLCGTAGFATEPQNERLSGGKASEECCTIINFSLWPVQLWLPGSAEGCNRSPLCHPVELHVRTPLSGALCRSLNKLLPLADPINLHYCLPQPICPTFLLSPPVPKVAITLLQVMALIMFYSRWIHSVYILFLSLKFLGKRRHFVPEEQLGLAAKAQRERQNPARLGEGPRDGLKHKREGDNSGHRLRLRI